MVVAIAMLCCVALLATGPTPEQKRIKRAALAYRSVPSSARDALNAVEKLESRIEVGMNHGDYITLVGETWDRSEVRPSNRLMARACRNSVTSCARRCAATRTVPKPGKKR